MTEASGNGAAPVVSVIIPVRNDAVQLGRCLDALSQQTFDGPFEIIVVDNGSTDDPGSVVGAHDGARLLFEPQESSYAARNLGVRQAAADVLAFIDSDCIPANDWLERGFRHLTAEEGPAFVGGRVDVFPRDPSAPTPTERYEAIHAFPQREYVEQHNFSGAGNLFVRTEVFQRVGDFRGSLSGGDRDWGQRAHSMGVKPVYADDVLALHPARTSFAEMHRKIRRVQIGIGQVRLVKGESLGWKYVLRFVLVPPIPTIARNLRHASLRGFAARAQYVGYALLLYYAAGYERIRFVLTRRRQRGET